MVESVKQDGTSSTTTVAAGAAKKGVRGYLTGGLIGGGVGLGTAVTLGSAISKAANRVDNPKWEATLKGLGATVSWVGGFFGATGGAAAGAHLGGIVGVLDGASDGINRVNKHNSEAIEKSEDIAQKQLNQIVGVQDKQLAFNAKNAYNEGVQAGMMAATQAAHAGMEQAPAPTQETSADLGAPGTFTARIHPQSSLKVEMAPSQGAIKPDAVAAAQEEAANAPRQI